MEEQAVHRKAAIGHEAWREAPWVGGLRGYPRLPGGDRAWRPMGRAGGAGSSRMALTRSTHSTFCFSAASSALLVRGIVGEPLMKSWCVTSDFWWVLPLQRLTTAKMMANFAGGPEPISTKLPPKIARGAACVERAGHHEYIYIYIYILV